MVTPVLGAAAPVTGPPLAGLTPVTGPVLGALAPVTVPVGRLLAPVTVPLGPTVPALGQVLGGVGAPLTDALLPAEVEPGGPSTTVPQRPPSSAAVPAPELLVAATVGVAPAPPGAGTGLVAADARGASPVGGAGRADVVVVAGAPAVPESDPVAPSGPHGRGAGCPATTGGAASPAPAPSADAAAVPGAPRGPAATSAAGRAADDAVPPALALRPGARPD
ncbi:hypothetical protein [Cellulomonas sp. SLBN-39]|uniref:hypothetical protein n=1 Tax=Cellulomonas sp. SLBN-39 TaxID=2768446 RepID=UPI00114E83A7|nr:hypothetical protein [Cellulomonas sp. SLBN-39]